MAGQGRCLWIAQAAVGSGSPWMPSFWVRTILPFSSWRLILPLARKPASVGHEEMAAAVGPGLIALNALHFHARLRAGDLALILAGASVLSRRFPSSADIPQPHTHLTLQLASAWGARLLVTVSSAEEFNYLQDLRLPQGPLTQGPQPLIDMLSARIVDLTSEQLADAVAQESGGLGVDCIVGPPVNLDV